MDKITIKEEDHGVRLDKYLSRLFPGISRAVIQKNIAEGQVLVDRQKTKPSYALKAGNVVVIEKIKPRLPDTAQPQRGELDIVHEENDFLVVNKPRGLVVHPAHANPDHTLINYLLMLRPGIAEAVYDPDKQISRLRPGVVHRLDKDTTGLIIIAKNKIALAKLSGLIQRRKINKTYLALVSGWPDKEGSVKTFLRRSSADRRKMSTHNFLGKESETAYKVIKYFEHRKLRLALVEAHPITGRTHQIRVHLASIGFPIIGDLIYGNQISIKHSDNLKVKGQLLHAGRLQFRYKGTDYDFFAPLPQDFIQIISKFKEINEQ